MSTAVARFYRLWSEVADLESTIELLNWDQETMMPPAGQERRGDLLATLAALRHRRLTSAELADSLEEAGRSCDAESLDGLQILAARREIERVTRVPERLIQALARAGSEGLARWGEARKDGGFPVFAPILERILELRREEAAARDIGEHRYDSLLDEYEPDMRTSRLIPLFEELAQELGPLVDEAAADLDGEKGTLVRGDFPPEAQLEFGTWAASRIGFDFARGRIDASQHPFCAGFGPSDVRITWRCERSDFRPALYGILHEAGHGIYEQGLPVEWRRTPLGVTRSMGMHESQSRLWENHVGRSVGFWRFALPRFRATFPDWQGVPPEQLWPALNQVQRSLVRVDADEITYNLHIIVRFRLELALLSGELAVRELPAAWSDEYERLLGVRPRNDKQGVLQDIHWASGLFGYFPTYALGSLLAAQLARAAESELGDLEEIFAAGAFDRLREWLRENIHRHGSRYSATQLTERATGRPLEANAFLDYARTKLVRLRESREIN